MIASEAIDEAKLKRRTYERAYREKNREKVLEKNRRWYARNAETERERKLAYRNENLEKARKYSREYNAENKPRIATIARNRRAKQRRNGGSHTQAEVDAIMKMQRGKCAICRAGLDGKCHVDHIISLKAGGSNDRRNLQILCVPCNKSKAARDPIDFMRMRGMLL